MEKKNRYGKHMEKKPSCFHKKSDNFSCLVGVPDVRFFFLHVFFLVFFFLMDILGDLPVMFFGWVFPPDDLN